MTTHELNQIKQLIVNPSKMAMGVPFTVSSYREFVEIWKNYKTNKRLITDDFLIRNIFNFHQSNINHVILYYCYNFDTCLLMCKINQKYCNVEIPCDNLKSHRRNIVATYV